MKAMIFAIPMLSSASNMDAVVLWARCLLTNVRVWLHDDAQWPTWTYAFWHIPHNGSLRAARLGLYLCCAAFVFSENHSLPSLHYYTFVFTQMAAQRQD